MKSIEAALGKTECDLIFRNVNYLDVFSCAFKTGDVAVHAGKVVALDSGLKAKREIDGKGRWLVPGFIDAHVHIESSMMLPHAFERSVLEKGTTTAICDPHEISNVVGVRGLEYFLEAAEKLSFDLRVMLSSCVPATHLETNGGGELRASDLARLKGRKKALGLAEVMNVPGVLFGDENMHEKLALFEDQPRDGHAPLVRGRELSAYASTGISSCHESSELEEAAEKVSKGISVWIREGSVAKDLRALSPLLTLATSTSMGFCTDDRNPLDIAEEGHIDFLIRSAIRYGVPATVAYRAASFSVARHYGLDRGFERKGAIAPGYAADLVLLDDFSTCSIEKVFLGGVETSEAESDLGALKNPAYLKNTMKAKTPAAEALLGPTGSVNIIRILEGKIVTGHEVDSHDARGVAKLSVLERHGKGLPPANAYVRGLGESFRGAIASSVGHDSHNLIVAGTDTRDMAVALQSLIECGGGFSIASGGAVKARLELPYGGLMSDRSPEELKGEIRTLKEASRSIGCPLPDPFIQLAFLSLPVIPALKLTDRGLVDVNRFEFIPVRAS